MTSVAFRTVAKAMSEGFGIDPDCVDMSDDLTIDWGLDGGEIAKLLDALHLDDRFGDHVTVRELVESVAEIL